MRILLAGLLVASTALTPLISAPAYAQSVSLGTQGPATRALSLPKGKSAIIDLPTDARDVLVSNPKVADVVLRTPRRLYVLGVGSGQTDAVFYDGSGRQILALDIRVDQDVAVLADTIGRMIPGAQVKVEALNDSIVLSGLVASASDADRAVKLAEAFSGAGGGARGGPSKVLNMMTIAGKDQVMLKVRVVEMQRSVIKQLGVNLNAVLNQVGEPQYLIGTALGFGANGGILGGLGAKYDYDTTKQPVANRVNPVTGVATDIEVVDREYPLSGIRSDRAGDPNLNQAQAALQALERVGLIRTLAEPNLTAVSGESAKFLAGGEYPVPTSQDITGRVGVEFKPFGVGLGFTPVVLSGGRISLRLSTEVSELTNNGAFTLAGAGGQAGLTIPALNVRRAETTVELPSGGSMMIAGLLQERTRQSVDSLPGLMNLPVLGGLFRSRDYVSGETELVIIVEPYLVTHTAPSRMQTPADGFKVASDPEAVLLGKLSKRTAAPKGAPPPAPYQGPVGYVIE
ncbi:MAG: type II and III secretion system protein family protein [Proteobacteria bacterium]|nr:type II and III secretion system protein family protein [Pseudomonadota bacterium]